LGHSRGGFSTKIHAVVDAKGRPLHVTLTPGQRHEMTAAHELLEHARGKALIGDAGYDSNEFRLAIHNKGMKAVICSKPERNFKPKLNRALYRRRYLVEVFFHHLKRFRAVATRYDKTARNYLAITQLACAQIWLNALEN
jgi:transposase